MAISNVWSSEGLETTDIPEQLVNFGQHYPDLKPRDVAVLMYLLSRPTVKFVKSNEEIAKATNMGVSTVARSLRVLQKNGFASYARFANGQTEWTIKIPEPKGGK